jgi:YolD-like protein
MLPEHVKELRRYIHEEYYDIPEPIIDAQQMEEMNELVLEAMEYHIPLSFVLYQHKSLVTFEGYIHYTDLLKKVFRIFDLSDHIQVIPIQKVKAIHKYEKAMDT